MGSNGHTIRDEPGSWSRRAPAGVPAPRSRAVLTVLVAEDDEGMRDVVAEVLRSRGYRVLTARDGAEGISLAEADDLQIDCVVTDLVMPGASGSRLAERARLRWARVPVLLISGQVVDRGELAARFGPLASYLRKPFTPDVLLQELDALFGLAAAGPAA